MKRLFRRLGMGVGAIVAVPVLLLLHWINRRWQRSATATIARLGAVDVPGLVVDPQRVGAAVNLAGRLAGTDQTGCLARAQLIWLVISWGGARPTIRVGAGADLGVGGIAHAWVELDDQVIGESPAIAEQYPPFDRPLLT